MRTSRGRTVIAAVAAVALGVTLLVVSTDGPAATAAGAAAGRCAADPPPNRLPADFEGSRLLVLSDADMTASAFMDGKLEPGDRGARGEEDALTVAITVFDHYDPRQRRGSVQFLTLARDDCPNLIPTHVELEVPAGPHSVHLIH